MIAAYGTIERDLMVRLWSHLGGHGDVLPVSRADAGLSSRCDGPIQRTGHR
ncbi:hypothetical protein KQH49_12660 [Mycetohabitans sp. B5]|uniref:hypothetical protein n=1 Tax=Mycetohabitans TaxID=2571159 RepID=UPI001304E978|nr:hypothetical protein [Mycetohabitans sp. B5]MCG1055731.1 hypothetical protein [Mycetohabitans sp. B5]